jgi:two-component system response regulator AtoC
MLSGNILAVDDDVAMRTVLAALLTQQGHAVRMASSGHEALQILETQPPDLLITDVQMPGMSGVELLKRCTSLCPDVPVILLTAHGTIPMAIDAIKAGAEEFLTKPFDRSELLCVVDKVLTKVRAAERQLPRYAMDATGILGRSAALTQVKAMLRRAAPTMSTVLVRGESGTGKELIAKALHEMSPRSGAPLVKINCGALPDALLESELFGYEKGAFTGAIARKPGRVELAHRGTLFLDEIGDITPALQVKLLRVLQEREFERLGGTQTLKVDVRFVAATHRDLEDMVRKGDFREDLFYRLNVIPMWVPPLRERREDVAVLAAHFRDVFAEANHRPDIAFHPDAVRLLAEQDWPGNVRQLQNLIERLVVVTDWPLITADVVRAELRRSPSLSAVPESSPSPAAEVSTLDEHRRTAEREALVKALKHSFNNRTVAARLLGVSRRTFYTKLEAYGLL